jgi:hypothetical protein
MAGLSIKPPEPDALDASVKVFKPAFNDEKRTVLDLPTRDVPMCETLLASLAKLVVAPDTEKDSKVVEPELVDKPCEVKVTHALVPV